VAAVEKQFAPGAGVVLALAGAMPEIEGKAVSRPSVPDRSAVLAELAGSTRPGGEGMAGNRW
jgi:hypothetical protein